jgi:hypothetical protein
MVALNAIVERDRLLSYRVELNQRPGYLLDPGTRKVWLYARGEGFEDAPLLAVDQ